MLEFRGQTTIDPWSPPMNCRRGSWVSLGRIAPCMLDQPMSDTTKEQYEARILELEAEVARLRRQPALTIMGTVAANRPRGGMTVLGSEEMILQVGIDDAVGYVNSPMARLLSMPNRQAVLGTPLALWDRGPLGEGLLLSLVHASRTSNQVQGVEKSYPSLPLALLPASTATRPNCDPILSFVATPKEGRVHVVVQEVTKLRWLELTFARFVSPKVIERMQEMPAEDFLSMERREVTVVFCDMRGFTSLCQQEEPERVQSTVNTFLENMVECIESLDGTVQGFVGDQVMALFGAPVHQPDHAVRGLVCAATMHVAHERWKADRASAGLPVRDVGIGLAAGRVVVGNIGTPSRMDYTAQGHAVNLAARLCSAAAGGEILTVRETHGMALQALSLYEGAVKVPRLTFEDRGVQHFKNVSEPVRVVSVAIKG